MNKISNYLYNTFSKIEKETSMQKAVLTNSDKLQLCMSEWKSVFRNRDNLLFNSQYVPDRIKKKARKMRNTFYLVTFDVYSKMKFSYYIYTTGNIPSKQLKKYIEYLMFLSHFIYEIMVRRMCGGVNRIDFKSVHVHLFMTGYKKLLPKGKHILNEDNVNSGLTEAYSDNGTLVIFRKEDWYKTLIHELLHLFGADQYTLLDKWNKPRLLKLFQIQSSMAYGESYIEFWTNTLQCAILSFYRSNRCIDMFHLYFKTYMKLELQFSLYQANKILNYMSLNYNGLIRNTNNLNDNFKEGTNVFCYYILKTVLLYYSDSFFEWCIQNNTKIFKLKKESNIYDFVYNHYNQASFLNTMHRYMELTKKHQSIQHKRRYKSASRSKKTLMKSRKRSSRSSKHMYEIRVKNIKKYFKYNTLRMTILDLPNEL